jgi:hypothetical protein
VRSRFGRFFLARRKTPNDPAREVSQYFVFLLRRHAKKNNNAVAEKHDKRAVFDPEGQGGCRQNLVTFESRGVDTVAQ